MQPIINYQKNKMPALNVTRKRGRLTRQNEGPELFITIGGSLDSVAIIIDDDSPFAKISVRTILASTEVTLEINNLQDKGVTRADKEDPKMPTNKSRWTTSMWEDILECYAGEEDCEKLRRPVEPVDELGLTTSMWEDILKSADELYHQLKLDEPEEDRQGHPDEKEKFFRREEEISKMIRETHIEKSPEKEGSNHSNHVTSTKRILNTKRSRVVDVSKWSKNSK